jgi:hypothetical protein
VDEPRKETKHQQEMFDARGRQTGGWTNKLIWGDNKLILSSLKAGALRRQIEDAGGLKLIYIDPPFDVGADFSMDIVIPSSEGTGETFHKEPNILEQIAYRDTWGHGADSFISMIYERLILMRDLLAEDGSIYVHCDWRMNALIRLAMQEVFGSNNFINEIVWKRRTGILNQSRKLATSTDSIYLFSKNRERYAFNQQFIPYTDDDPYVRTKFVYKDESGRRYRLHAITSRHTVLVLFTSTKATSLLRTAGHFPAKQWKIGKARNCFTSPKIKISEFSGNSSLTRATANPSKAFGMIFGP